MLVNAIDTAFEDAEKAFNRVGMDSAPGVFTLAMSHNVMVSELGTDQAVLPSIISHKVGFGNDIRLEIGLQGVSFYAGNMERADLAVALHKRENSVFVPVSPAGFLPPRLNPDVRFIRFYWPISAQHFRVIRLHGFTNPVRHKPRGFIGDMQETL